MEVSILDPYKQDEELNNSDLDSDYDFEYYSEKDASPFLTKCVICEKEFMIDVIDEHVETFS